MAKITSVEPQKKNLPAGRQVPKRFNIFLDGEFAFGADEDLVVNRRLVVGKQIQQDDLDQILFEAEVGRLMEKMYRLFNIRQRSEKEVRDYFKKLSFKRKIKDQEQLSPHIIDTAVQLMKRQGMINDEQFAKSWMESRSKKYGPQRIKQELFQKGIEREIIDEVLGKQVIDDSQKIAQKLLEKKIGRWKGLDSIQLRKKAYEFLLRRGFGYDLVQDIVENFIKKG